MNYLDVHQKRKYDRMTHKKNSTLSSSVSPMEQFQKQTTHIILQTAVRHNLSCISYRLLVAKQRLWRMLKNPLQYLLSAVQWCHTHTKQVGYCMLANLSPLNQIFAARNLKEVFFYLMSLRNDGGKVFGPWRHCFPVYVGHWKENAECTRVSFMLLLYQPAIFSLFWFQDPGQQRLLSFGISIQYIYLSISLCISDDLFKTRNYINEQIIKKKMYSERCDDIFWAIKEEEEEDEDDDDDNS